MFKKLCLFVCTLLPCVACAFGGVTLSDRLDNLNDVSIQNDLIRNHIEAGGFEYVFNLYQQLEQERTNVEYFSTSVGIGDIANRLLIAQKLLTHTTYDVITSNTGKILPVDSDIKPGGIIVLGVTPQLGILESRLDQAYKLAILYPNIPIIVSGKGRKSGVVEADYMYNYLVAKGIDSHRIFKESESEDTVGNAVFTYFTIVQEASLKGINQWLIVTNNFHAMRALFNFSRVFPLDHKIAVFLAPLLSDGVQRADQDKILEGLITSEISTDSNQQFLELLEQAWFNADSYSFEHNDISGQPCAILNEVLFKHALYKDKLVTLTMTFQCVMGLNS